MKDKNIRIKRVENLLKATLYEIIKNNLKDPRLKSVTITHVDLSRDLKFSKVYFSILIDINDEREIRESDCLASLENAKKAIRHLLLKQTDLKYVPGIKFFVDRSEIHANRIENILNEIKQEKVEDELDSD